MKGNQLATRCWNYIDLREDNDQVREFSKMTNNDLTRLDKSDFWLKELC